MKNIGIIRRLDELGRVVIPREYRKLHHINVGDPLEIFAIDTGSIIINKMDNTSDLIQVGEAVCTSLSAELGMTAAAANFERLLVCVGHGKQVLIERELPHNVVKMLKNRGSYNGPITGDEVGRFPDVGFSYIAVAPLFSVDECFGGLVAFSEKPISEAAVASLKLAGRLAGDALQRY
ncbi:MAG: AbrB/MazE/SpoVT family DNA-binding domain-containing protein [Firmicutes bacterium]|nr:AbrB/MazE/SpoVT family DNA-binding domain-containing protein [Bacillota bacterium]